VVSFRSDAPLETFVGTTNHGMQIPQLLFLKVANDIQMAVDLVFVRQ
jgi:hypothetical protein